MRLRSRAAHRAVATELAIASTFVALLADIDDAIAAFSKGKRRRIRAQASGQGVTVAAAFKELKSLGLLQDWTLKEAKRQAEECFGEVPVLLSAEDAAALLCHYYGAGPSARAQPVLTADDLSAVGAVPG